MRPNFPSKEELAAKPLSVLRNIDVMDGDEEKLLQEVISSKVQAAPPVRPINRSDVPDIKTAEEEAKWQAIVDQRVQDAMPKVIVDVPAQKSLSTSMTATVTSSVNLNENKTSLRFCQFCSSKGYRHKKNCTAKIKNGE